MAKFIDLSVTFKLNDENLTSGAQIKGQMLNHDDFGKLWKDKVADPEFDMNMLGTGTWWAGEMITLSAHSTTHFDAPLHYGPIDKKGNPTKSIDEIPLEWCFGDGVVIDVSHRGDMELITAADIIEGLQRIKYTLKPMDIVLIMTLNDNKYRGKPVPTYEESGCGMSAEATAYIVDQGVKVIGIDSYGFDLPLVRGYRWAKESGNQYWQAHLVGLDKEYCHMERMANFDKLPPFGFKVSCFPIAIEGLTGGWVRAVAILEE